MYTREFIHTFREAVRDADIPLPHKVLLFNMSTYANSDGCNVYPSQTVLARGACTTDRTVRRHLKHLQGSGWIELVKRGHSGDDRRTRSANRYQLQVGSEFTVKRGEVHLHEEPVRAATSTPEHDPERNRTEHENVPPAAPELPSADDDGWTPAYEF